MQISKTFKKTRYFSFRRSCDTVVVVVAVVVAVAVAVAVENNDEERQKKSYVSLTFFIFSFQECFKYFDLRQKKKKNNKRREIKSSEGSIIKI